jgi:hypothetical protein
VSPFDPVAVASLHTSRRQQEHGRLLVQAHHVPTHSNGFLTSFAATAGPRRARVASIEPSEYHTEHRDKDDSADQDQGSRVSSHASLL